MSISCDGKVERVYLNGREARNSTQVAGSLNGWNVKSYPLVLGNEAYDPRNWAGDIKFVAVYARALSAGQVQKAHKSPPPSPAGPGPDIF